MTRNLTLQAQVKDATLRLSADQRERMARFIAGHEDKFLKLTLNTSGKPTSSRQNRYYWSVIVGMIAEETGHEPEETHTWLKMKFLERQFIEMGGEEFLVPKSTKRLTTEEREVYHERIRAWAAQFLSLVIPLPNEA